MTEEAVAEETFTPPVVETEEEEVVVARDGGVDRKEPPKRRKQRRTAGLPDDDPDSGDELSAEDKLDVLWSWFQAVQAGVASPNGSQVKETQWYRCEGVDMMSGDVCGHVFEAPSVAVRVQTGETVHCPKHPPGTSTPCSFFNPVAEEAG